MNVASRATAAAAADREQFVKAVVADHFHQGAALGGLEEITEDGRHVAVGECQRAACKIWRATYEAVERFQVDFSLQKSVEDQSFVCGLSPSWLRNSLDVDIPHKGPVAVGICHCD